MQNTNPEFAGAIPLINYPNLA